MTGSLWELALASVYLLGTHFTLPRAAIRGRIVAKIGEGPYMGLFTLNTVVAYTWLVVAFNGAPGGPVFWSWGETGRQITFFAMPLCLLMLVGAFSVRDPMTAKPPADAPDGAAVDVEGMTRGILRLTRNPFLWSMVLWALAHLASHGSLRYLLLYGTIALQGAIGSYIVDAKLLTRQPEKAARYRELTSNLPLLAVVGGRQSLGRAFAEYGIMRVFVAGIVFSLLMSVHEWLFGVSAAPIYWM